MAGHTGAGLNKCLLYPEADIIMAVTGNPKVAALCYNPPCGDARIWDGWGIPLVSGAVHRVAVFSALSFLYIRSWWHGWLRAPQGKLRHCPI